MKMPIDYRTAEALFNELKPQVEFHELNHEAQMKWVRAARVVKNHSRKPMAELYPAEWNDDESVHANTKHKRKPKITLKNKGGQMVDEDNAAERLAFFDRQDAEDRQFITKKRWSDKSKDELKAFWRMQARNRRRKEYEKMIR